MSNFAERKPHAVLIPYPAQGHINALLKLAKLLHLRGFHITFVNTEYNHKRLLKSRGPKAFDGLIDFTFETIPDGLTPMDGDGDVTQDVRSLCQSILNNFHQFFDELLAKLHESATSGHIPPVTCLVSDSFMPFTVDSAEEHALPIVLFSPCSACFLLSNYHVPKLFQNGVLPLKDESYLINGYLDTIVDWIPVEMTGRYQRASAIIFNTSDELERDIMNALSSILPSLYTIGPLASFLNQSPQNRLIFLESNLWEEDTNCLEWLELKDHESVVYVNFGSVTVMTEEKLLEFAWGLANSKKPFLWIITPDLVIGGTVVLSSEFVNEISDRGLIASWCPQEKVLNHPSVGGFLTHCGWNSTTESVCAGVPMLCWPFLTDQPPNSRLICNEWEIGIEIVTNVKREEVEKLVNELMVGEKGKEMRKRAMELKKKVEEETRPGGSSYINLDQVIKEILLKNY
ncbi:7-deoxyloganetin glucosyltransferase-like isoform X2 [Vicia villosa]|uniref:7-deoxyloganetin glucosyltransferase-like isoform X2 n=1 Tax=Vicia villosa TaxID=3911 RepID=UPI00273BC7F5|nr:7-deoxyloganetin glucosyltransferase-like isoform X2 [Vicia villosa]